MSLRINKNTEALQIHRNLAKNDKMLSKSLERLSSGQKINTAGDGPASLVISENLRAQIGGLQQAIDNNTIAVSLVQTAEGALNEVSRLLVDVRQRAIASANVGANDPAMTEASQMEIENALDAIDRIAVSTTFGKKRLLDGSNSASGNTTGQGLQFMQVSSKTQESGEDGYEVKVHREARQAEYISGSISGESIQAGEELIVREGGREVVFRASETDTLKSAVEVLASKAKRAGLEVTIELNEANEVTIRHNQFGGDHSFEMASSRVGVFSQVSSGDATIVSNGADIEGTINGEKQSKAKDKS